MDIKNEILDFLENLYGCAHVTDMGEYISVSNEENRKSYRISIIDTTIQ